VTVVELGWWRREGNGDGGGARVVTGVYVWGEIVMGRHGEVNPNLYRGEGGVRYG
jgi:hypothetical protein